MTPMAANGNQLPLGDAIATTFGCCDRIQHSQGRHCHPGPTDHQPNRSKRTSGRRPGSVRLQQGNERCHPPAAATGCNATNHTHRRDAADVTYPPHFFIISYFRFSSQFIRLIKLMKSARYLSHTKKKIDEMAEEIDGRNCIRFTPSFSTD